MQPSVDRVGFQLAILQESWQVYSSKFLEAMIAVLDRCELVGRCEDVSKLAIAVVPWVQRLIFVL